jgi:hypothetical protein
MIAPSRKRGSLWLTIVMAFLVLPVLPASASTITYKILFEADNIRGPSHVPTTTATGRFTLTFDPTHDYAVPGDFAGSSIITNVLSIPVDSAVGFLYDHLADQLTIGGISGGPEPLTTTEHDFALVIGTFTTSPTLAFDMSDGHLGKIWGTNDGFVIAQIVAPPVAPTPIPATLPLLVTALAGLVGWKVTRRRWTMAAAD